MSSTNSVEQTHLGSEKITEAILSYEANQQTIIELRSALDEMLGAFAEGVVWNDEQRVAYEAAAKVAGRR